MSGPGVARCAFTQTCDGLESEPQHLRAGETVVHHVMLTHWLDTSQPNDGQRTVTVSDDDPAVVRALVVRHLDRLLRGTVGDADAGVEDGPELELGL